MTLLRRGLSLLVAVSLPAVALAAPAKWLDQRVTVEVTDAPLEGFLDALSRQAKVNFVITEGLEGRKVTASLRDVKVSQALDVAGRLDSFDYRQLDKTNTFIVAPTGSQALSAPRIVGAGPELERRVTVRVKDDTLADFLVTLSRQARVQFTLDPSVGDKKLTVFLRNVTARDALDLVLALKGLSCRRLAGEKPVYQVSAA